MGDLPHTLRGDVLARSSGIPSGLAHRGRVFAAEASLFTLTMMLSNVAVAEAIDDFGDSPFALARAMGVLSLLVGALWLAGVLRRRAPTVEPTA